MKRPQSDRASPLQFSSPLFFSGFLVDFLDSIRGEEGLTAYIEEGEAVARWGGDRPPHNATFLHMDLSVKKIYR